MVGVAAPAHVSTSSKKTFARTPQASGMDLAYGSTRLRTFTHSLESLYRLGRSLQELAALGSCGRQDYPTVRDLRVTQLTQLTQLPLSLRTAAGEVRALYEMRVDDEPRPGEKR